MQHIIQRKKDMKKILGFVPLFALTIMFVQCTGNSKRANIVVMESHKTTHMHYDSIISMERLKRNRQLTEIPCLNI